MSIKHLFLFTVGAPNTGAFSGLGHFTMNLTTNTTEGIITFVATDASWIAHATLEEFEFTDDEFSGRFGFTAIHGIPPFPLLPITTPFGPVPVNTPIISPNIPNLFIIAGDTPPVPPQVL